MAALSSLCFEPVCWRAGREGGFSRSPSGWIVISLPSRRGQVREQNKQIGNVETIHDEPK